MAQDLCARLREKKLISIVRGAPTEKITKIADAIYRGGFRFMEITFDQSGKTPHAVTAEQIRIVREYYRGDFYAFIEQYFAMVGEIYDKTHCDIVGHFDLVTKFNEDGSLFDTSHPRYRAAALAALDRLCACPVIFEVNTGAIARGYRKTPYPENWLLDELRRRKMPLLLCSDCHDRRFLLCGMDELKQKIPEAREKLFG